MLEDMTDIERLTWIELRFGITKTVGENPTNDRIESVENELMAHLNRCKENLKIQGPLPRVRMWITNDKVNFLFFDKRSGRRVILGEWLSNKEPARE